METGSTEAKLSALETQFAVLKNQFDNLQNAIKQQAVEYERRLTELNHAYVRAADDNQKFLTISVFDARIGALMTGIDARFNQIVADQKESQKWHVAMDVWKSKQSGVLLGVAAVAGLISGAISMLASIWTIGK